ncbi:hypothetical protein FA95DRAFT_1612047 [Auriscalpium vulgare]|uniref:Uncharacterized protein n=1 Tax=Auriscalpium vulgare TaxID=40419 RepID=A0ACB8R893_9AGAM|nr:hypothetical protein FA95DRAFT_1612047 [Auriscalpium vulgare]
MRALRPSGPIHPPVRRGTLGVLPNPSGGIAIGEWHALRDPADKQITFPSLAFISDLFAGFLPPVVAKLGPSWFPTVVLSLEFKAPIPRGATSVGAYVTSRFIADPQGRHDVYCELWTAPQGEDDGGNWREKQRCLLVSHQTALVMSAAVNKKKGKGKSRL